MKNKISLLFLVICILCMCAGCSKLWQGIEATTKSTEELIIETLEEKYPEKTFEVLEQDGLYYNVVDGDGIEFQVDPVIISLHLKNIYKEKELEQSSTTEKFSVVRKEGSRNIRRNLEYYNLDAIIAVGYRVNSMKTTRFRQWATRTLKEYITKALGIFSYIMGFTTGA